MTERLNKVEWSYTEPAENEYRVISPDAIRAARGYRSRAKICAAVNQKMTPQQLYNYENGVNGIAHENLPILLKALGVTYEEITVPVILEMDDSIPDAHTTNKEDVKHHTGKTDVAIPITTHETGLTEDTPANIPANLDWLYND